MSLRFAIPPQQKLLGTIYREGAYFMLTTPPEHQQDYFLRIVRLLLSIEAAASVYELQYEP